MFWKVIGVPLGVDPGPYIANFKICFDDINLINSLYKKDYRRALASKVLWFPLKGVEISTR